jgi:urease accessory protein
MMTYRAPAVRHFLPAVLASMLAPAVALAHAGHDPAAPGIVTGLLHPLTGPDHLLAMLAVGIWAAQLRGRAAWLLPALFPAVMMIGAGVALAGVAMPAVEPVIALSVLVLGVAVMLNVRPPLVVSAALVGWFALAHGHAHGAELPLGGDVAGYATGFAATTVALHLTGLFLGLLGRRLRRDRITRFAGLAIAASGVALVAF